MLNREAILNARISNLKTIEVPEWGGSVYLRKWTGKDRNRFLEDSVKISSGGDVEVKYDKLLDNMLKAVALSLCDETGTRLFEDSEEDIALLADKEADVLQMLYDEVMALNALNSTATADAAKNSSAIQRGDSISASLEELG